MLWNSKWFPGTNLQDINLDWILKKVSALRGGSTGQYLYKKSDKDFDFGWKTGGGGGGTSDYLDLDNKPSINSVELIGNKTAADLGLAASSDIPEIPVQSVNGKTGAVVLSASDVGAYVKPAQGIPASDLASDVLSPFITKTMSNTFLYSLYGKKINILGDSISNNADDWPGYIPAENNITLNNISVGGIKISGSGGLATKTSELDTNADINIIFAGTNDYNAQVNIGANSDASIDTFYGALNTLLSYIATNIPASTTYIVTPLKRFTVSNASTPLEIYCYALYKMAAKYGATIIDAYHNAPNWNPLVTSLAHWCNTDKVHPLPAYNSAFLMPYIMSKIASKTSDIGSPTASDFTVELNSTYYTTPATTILNVTSDGVVNITLTGTFTNSGSSAIRAVIGTLPVWARTGRQEWGVGGMLHTGISDPVAFYVSAIGAITLDLIPGSAWYYAHLSYQIN